MFAFKDSKNREGVVELMKAIAGKEWQEKAWTYGPSRSDVYSKSIWSKGFSDIGAEGISSPGVTLAGVTQAMNDSITEVLQERKAPQKAAAWLNDVVNASLSDTGELSKQQTVMSRKLSSKYNLAFGTFFHQDEGEMFLENK